MFWSANYIVVRELNFLLKEENVTLTQVLEADDILQECKADNKALVQFLTRPEILAELITLITEEPPKNVELASQYRHANIACEVLTSHLSMLSDRLSLDTTQMNRLCDFLNKDPPLNPLLASYFSKTVEMLLERSPKQDCYLYHIVCLRVLDFFKARRDFLPNLLRHMATSAIADTFKYFIRLDRLFKKIVLEWLEEHHFLEGLIQIICGTYVPEELAPPPPPPPQPSQPPQQGEQKEKAECETSEKEHNHTEDNKETTPDSDGDKGDGQGVKQEAESDSDAARAAQRQRVAAVASANAAALLCDLVATGCAGDGWSTRPRISWALAFQLLSEEMLSLLLQNMFTCSPHARRAALVNGTQLLRALLTHEPMLRSIKASCPSLSSTDEGGIEEQFVSSLLGAVSGSTGSAGSAGQAGSEPEEPSGVELAIAPHLPLLHHALLHHSPEGGGAMGAVEAVGVSRVGVAGLVAQLALSELPDVSLTLLTLGTPQLLLDMFFKHPNNNFLHAQVYTFVKHALTTKYRGDYAKHLFLECDLLTRLMDVFEENKNNKGCVRAAYMGHVVLMLSRIARALAPPDPLQVELPPELAARWNTFLEDTLRPLLHHHDTPLGGYYPSENIYEVEIMADTLATNYDFNDMAGTATMDELADDVNADDNNELCGAMSSSVENADFIADGLGIDDADKMTTAKNNFLELASQRFDDDMWEDSGETDLQQDPDEVRDVLDQESPWGSGGGAVSSVDLSAGWAQFSSAAVLPPHDPFAPSPATPATPAHPAPPAPSDHTDDFTPFWSYDTQHAHDTELEASMHKLRVEGEGRDKSMDEASSAELANNLLTAMSAMTPDAIANIVNANTHTTLAQVTQETLAQVTQGTENDDDSTPAHPGDNSDR